MVRRLGCCVGLMMVAACGQNGASEGYATGVVRYQNQPVAYSRVVFYDANGATIIADVGPQGRYGVRIRPGEYRVAIQEASIAKAEDSPTSKVGLRGYPERYTDPDSSRLTFKVKPGENRRDFNLLE